MCRACKRSLTVLCFCLFKQDGAETPVTNVGGDRLGRHDGRGQHQPLKREDCYGIVLILFLDKFFFARSSFKISF